MNSANLCYRVFIVGKEKPLKKQRNALSLVESCEGAW